jgi:putative PIN family toxin of toxin-antitoxin system
MKIVLDTNVLVSGVFWGGIPLKILDLWQKEKIEVLASNAILDEYLRTIYKIAQSANRIDLFNLWAFLLPSKVGLISIKKSFHLCRDPNDNMFLDCAISGRAQFIVSEDKDLLVLNKIMNVKIVTAKNFLKEI